MDYGGENMYNKILVPLDGSLLAEVVLWYAARLTGRLRASLTLAYVSSPDELTSQHMYECYLKDTVLRVKAQAEKAARETTKAGEVIVDHIILKGDPAEEILDYADKKKIDLIILATQGKSGVRRWALGNVANKVVSATRKQVLLIRAKGGQPDVSKVKLTRVLVPVDGSRESESILKFVNYLAVELDLSLTLLHMFNFRLSAYPSRANLMAVEKERKRRQTYIEKLGSRLKAQGLQVNAVFSEISADEEAAEIIKMAEEGNFNMVAMATHGRSGIGRWIFGSNAQKVLYEGGTPLLLVRPVKGRHKTQ
jgi:nucleotide-binding universal stress UspA family protein